MSGALRSTAIQSKDPGPALNSSADDNIDVATGLYGDCLAYFTTLSQTSSMGFDQMERESFKKDLGRLYLWGEDFQDGKLGKMLKHSPDLKTTVFRLLTALGSALIISDDSIQERRSLSH